jgi:hypothetical protein
VKSLKKFGLNLSLKVWFEKSLKKKRKKKKTYLFTLSARRPSSQPISPPQQPTPPTPISILFISLTSRPHRLVSLPLPSFLLPLLCLARPGAAANPAAPGRLPLPFLPVQVDQLRQLTLVFSIRPFLFP